jgi:hypothetical protein
LQAFVRYFFPGYQPPPPPQKKKKNLVRAQKIGPKGRGDHKNGTGSSFFEKKNAIFLLNVILLDDLLITE